MKKGKVRLELEDRVEKMVQDIVSSGRAYEARIQNLVDEQQAELRYNVEVQLYMDGSKI